MNTHHQKLKIKVLPFLVAVAMFMQMLDSSILNTAIPSIAKDFGVLPIKLDVSVTAFIFTTAILLPISSWLADKFKIKRVFFLAIAIFSLGSLLCAMSANLTQLTLSRIVQGVGGAILLPVGRLAVLKIVPRSDYLKVMSFIIMPALIGPILGPTLGGFLVQYLSWRWIFLVNVPVGILCCAGTVFLMPVIRSAKVNKFDWAGFLLFDLAIALLFLAGSDIKVLGLPAETNFILGIGFILIYGFYAKGRKNALFSLEMFKTNTFSIGIIGNLIIRLAGGAWPFLIPLFLQVGMGFSPVKSGMSLIPFSVGGLISSAQVSPLVKRYGYKKFLLVNSALIAGGVFCLSFVTTATPYWILVVLFAFLGMTNFMQFGALNALTLKDVDDKFLGESNSMLSLAMQISMAMGVSLSALLVESLQGDSSHILSLTQFHKTFFIIALFSIVSGSVFLFIKGKSDDGGGNVRTDIAHI